MSALRMGLLALLLGTTAIAATGDDEYKGVLSEITDTAATTPAEKARYAEGANDEMVGIARNMAKLLEQVSKDGDPEAVACVEAKATSLSALQRVSSSSESTMNAALDAGDDARALHEFRKIAVALSKARMLYTQAQRCSQDPDRTQSFTTTEWESYLDAIVDNWEDPLDPETLDVPPGDPPDVTPFK